MTLVLIAGLLFSIRAVGQAPPPPPPTVRITPTPAAPLSAEELEAKVAQSISKPVAWRQYSPKGFGISVALPRDPISQEERFYDESFGNVRLEMQTSVGDGVIYLLGRMVLPYAVTDEKLLRETYRGLAEGFQEESAFKFCSAKDFHFDGKLGVELTAPAGDPRYAPIRFRGLVLDRVIFMQAALPTSTPGESEPPSKTDLNRIHVETTRFFDSVAVVRQPSAPPRSSDPPMFTEHYDGKSFRNDHFGFSFSPPTGWLKVSQGDVDGIRKVGKEIVAASTGKELPTPKARQNLATFVSKPLGNEGVAMIAFNLGVRGTSIADAERMAKSTEDLLSKLPIYHITREPELAKIGGRPAYVMETTIKLSESRQKQTIYFFPRREFVIGLTVTYYDAADRDSAISAIEGITFSGAATQTR